MADLAPIAAPEPMTIGALTLTERADLSLLALAIPDGGEAAFAAALKKAHKLDMPTARMSTQAGQDIALKTSPDALLLVVPGTDPYLPAKAAKAMGDTAYVTDQTGAFCALELSGESTLDALERLCPIDLSETAFPTGAFARTVMEHIGTLIVRLDKTRFLLLCPSSSANSFRHAVETSCHYVTA